MNKNCVYFESNQHLSSVTFSPSNKDSLGTIYKDIEECTYLLQLLLKAAYLTCSVFNVKVVHLVRDARPLIMSRSSGGFGTLDGIHPRGDKYTEQVKSKAFSSIWDYFTMFAIYML